MNQSSTPLWLDLKTNYIDDNFEKLVEYLRSTVDKNDSLYKETLKLLEKRIEELIDIESSRRLYDEPATHEETIFNIKLLVVYLLTIRDDAKFQIEAFIALMEQLMHITPRRSQELLNKISECLRYTSIDELGFGWYEYDNYLGKEVFVMNVCQNVKFGKERALRQYANQGTLLINNDNIFISSQNIAKTEKLATSPSISIEADTGIHVITSQADKLKATNESNILEIETFARNFVREQQQCEQSTPEEMPLKRYSAGDEALVKVISKFNDEIHVSTIDTHYEKVSGEITFESDRDNIMFYQHSDIYKFLRVGDIIKATVIDTNPGEFGIEDQFKDYIMSEFIEIIGYGETMAKCLFKTKSQVWFTEDGLPLFTRTSDYYDKEDVAVLKVTNIYGSDDNRYGKIESEIIESVEDDFDIREAQRQRFRAFVESFKSDNSDTENESETITHEALSETVVKLLVRYLFHHQKGLLKPSRRYKVLAQALFLATLIEDNDTAAYIDFAKNYLRALVAFVNNDEIVGLMTSSDDKFASAESTRKRIAIVEILKEYGRKDKSQLLNDTINSENVTLARIAQLIQSSNRMQGILSSAALNVIKHEIIKLLSIENENETDLEADSGTFIGMESSTIEFKTSIVFVPGETNTANLIKQGKNVMRGVCAFLNSTTGGNLYIGVNDQGYVSGIENDMKYLNCKSIDSYKRYIQDNLIIPYLGLDAATYVKIEPLHDNRVVVLHVEPHPYQVVELDNKAYIRVNSESRPMDESTRHEMLALKMSKQKEKAANVSLLQRACQQKKCVILHRYESSNSGKIADRKVEPYKVLVHDNMLMAFDHDKRDCRIFSLSRIDYVELLDESWGNTALHQDIEVDSFHLSGKKPITISLQLDMLARNLLIEEYPRTHECIKRNATDNNVWYYNDTVRNIVGIGRFYMGLANHIKIIDAPELEEFAKQQLKNFPINLQ